ncbi:MAG: type I-F CRISPR-associated protein Csy3 [Alphaproteobacteria bacterium]|nr:type I-F CRISPR-associated protein Csy3 [Alphaproteobacteria bacterium]
MGKGAKKIPKTEIPSLLSVAKSIAPSEGLMYATNFDGEAPTLDAMRSKDRRMSVVEVRETTVRGVLGDFKTVHGGSDGEMEKQLDPDNANIQRIDVAHLPPGQDTLVIEFTVAYRADSLSPTACNDQAYAERLRGVVSRYAALDGYAFLGRKYAAALAGGGWMWRNAYGRHRRVLIQEVGGGMTFFFDPAAPDAQAIEQLGAAIGCALADKRPPLFFQVQGLVSLAGGAEVHPSQEFVDREKGGGNKKKGEKSRTYASATRHRDGGACAQALLHPQKIGNALRRIDDFHSQTARYGAIPVEPIGYVQNASVALRLPGRGDNDVYTLLKDLKTHAEDPLTVAGSIAEVPKDVHYLVACLVRGGVFSGASAKGGEE